MKTIYIAASWRHQHAVEMLTHLLRELGFTVRSFVENNYGEGHSATKPIPFEQWIQTDQADRAFEFDTSGAATSDAVIYIGNGGKDAMAECGIAWASKVPLFGLRCKGEDLGLMRKLFTAWFDNWGTLLIALQEHFYNELM